MPTSSLTRKMKGLLTGKYQSWPKVNVLPQHSLCSSSIGSPVLGEFPPWGTASNGAYYRFNLPTFP